MASIIRDVVLLVMLMLIPLGFYIDLRQGRLTMHKVANHLDSQGRTVRRERVFLWALAFLVLALTTAMTLTGW